MAVLRKLIGEKIRIIRKQKGMTQEELAEKANLQYQYIGAFERGIRNISIDSLEKIIGALNINYNELFTFDDQSISDKETNKEYIIFLHNELLRNRSLEEVKAIHRITEEILRSFK